MTLVTSPQSTEEWLRSRVERAQKSVVVAAPYVGKVLGALLRLRHKKVQARVVTSLRLSEVLSGATDIGAICELAESRVQIQSIPHLHAKIYLIDEEEVLVTSANPTHSGWRSNLEVGLAAQDSSIAQQILQTLERAQPYPWSTQQLRRYAQWAAERRLPRVRVPVEVPIEALQVAFAGWLRLTIQGVARLPEEFTLAQAYQQLLPLAAQAYPNNRHPKDKIRQQLQGLRDLGLLEFVAPGRYRRIKALEPLL